MRVGLILSAAIHLLLWVFIAFASPRPFTGAPPQAIEVAIVSANDAPPLPKGDAPGPPTPPDPPKPETTPDLSALAKPSETAVTPQPQPQAQARARAEPPSRPAAPPAPPPQSAAPPPPEQSIPDPAALAEMLMLPTPQSSKTGFDGQAERSAKLTAGDIAAFKAHLRSCAKISDVVATDKNLKVVVRVSLKPDGALAAPPVLIAASPSRHGPALVAGAIAALTACQPFVELPAAKYKEWKVLDVTLRPQDLVGG